jgi:hypothetical protein
LMFPDAEFLQRDPREVRELLLSYVALPVDSAELVAAFASPAAGEAGGGPSSGETSSSAAMAAATPTPSRPSHHHGHGTSVGYVILDCRSTESFHFACLPTALHVGDAIGFDAELLQKMRDRFAAARGSHLCILGTGRALIEEVNLLKLIVLHLVQHGFPYVSVATGGFRALIPFIKSGKVEFVRGGGPKTKPPHKGAAGGEHSPPPKKSSSVSCVPLAPTDDDDGAAAPKSAAPAASPVATASSSTVDEIKAKASSWGWGLMRAVTEKVDDLRRPKASASTDEPIAVVTTDASASPSPALSSPVPALPAPEAKPLFSTIHIPKTSTLPKAHVDPHEASVEVYRASSHPNRRGVKPDEDDDDELDLITSVAPPPPPPPAHAAPSDAAGLAEVNCPPITTSASIDNNKDFVSKEVVVASPPKKTIDEDMDFLIASPPARPAAAASVAALDATRSVSSGSKPAAKASTSRARSTQQAVDDFDDIFN